MTRLSVNVIGAGIGGLTTALALLRAGHHVRIFEQAADFREAGAGLTLTPNATRVLLHFDLGETLARIGSVPHRGAVLHWRSGRELVQNTRASDLETRYGAPYCQVHRADLHDALRDAIARHDERCLNLGARLKDLVMDDQQAVARFEDGRESAADVIVGADGVRSRVRDCVTPGEAPRFTGQVAWRGLLRVSLLDRAVLDPPSAMSIGPGRIFTRYLLRAGTLVNYVAIVRCAGWQDETWSTRGDRAELLAAYEGWHASIRDIIAATPVESLFKWALFDRPPLRRWSHGRCTLLGDAAHPLLPFLGQGAAMAIEDACVLARALSISSDVADRLRRYEAARLDRTARVAASSRDAGEHFQNANTDAYTACNHMSAMSLDLPAYDAVNVPV